MVASVLAREGLADSARALIADVRAEGSDNSFLHYYEAQVRIQLVQGQRVQVVVGAIPEFLEPLDGLGDDVRLILHEAKFAIPV